MPKLYTPSTIKTQINLVPFCWADWAVRAVLKNSSILLKYPTFEDGLFIFSWASLYCAQLETIWCSESEKYCDSWIEEIKESFKKGCSLELLVSLCLTVTLSYIQQKFWPSTDLSTNCRRALQLRFQSYDVKNVKISVVRAYDVVTRETR